MLCERLAGSLLQVQPRDRCFVQHHLLHVVRLDAGVVAPERSEAAILEGGFVRGRVLRNVARASAQTLGEADGRAD